ncbi:hypothetical protein CSW58_02095 [Caulobacter sp. B11]|uniref:hypothetical protein n=1 Tax=Caulobacter sp. B11 TaxID=2048899 RepID=UPI000C12A4F0|nr:hypothetical protein [Caulobacter sp. B11]PHY14000.1 hypothetical protein CSW58_02095 [Caulobacter sp. B11]
MIFEKTLTTLAAAAAIVAAAAVSVVAGAFAVYAVLLPLVGPAGGAAIVAAIFAVFAVIGALLMVRKADGGHARASAPTASQPDPFQLAERAFEMVKERPVLSAAAAIAAGVIAFRNPALVTIVAKAFMDLKQTPPR